jgi:mannose-1-phosphate guanylyltransferase
MTAEKKRPILPVIISGGAGRRLWPVSNSAFPKPFITMPDGQSLLKKAFLQASAQPDIAEILTVTNRDYYFKTRSEYSPANPRKIATSFILEPVGRNTAPAITMAALYANSAYGADTILLIMPADHLIADSAAFIEATSKARNLAEQGFIATFGIAPTYPATGYGYIEYDGNKVTRFIEKPALADAKKYAASGRHLWNSGIFCFKAGVFLHELSIHCPEIMEAAMHAAPKDWKRATASYIELEESAFSQIPDIPIDYALMEKSANLAVIACDIGWSDIGSWSAMADMVEADKNRNRLLGEVYTHASSNCFIKSSWRVIAAVGVENLTIVETADAVLVADRAQAEQVKNIASQLEENRKTPKNKNAAIFRPWGSYTIIEENAGFKIKRIEVLPGQKLSLQTHAHRSEHWVVISGKARVQRDGDIFELLPSESTYIAAGQKHRLQNAGQEMLVIIEVQCGLYLGEDDITRLDDLYERASETA